MNELMKALLIKLKSQVTKKVDKEILHVVNQAWHLVNILQTRGGNLGNDPSNFTPHWLPDLRVRQKVK